MIYTEVPRGHLPTIILSTLFDGDKYGYEIVKAIEIKTNGKISIKQPSLYSSLRRLEEQNLISSYWLDSELGGKRHYYRLTDMGRKQAEEWQKQLIDNQNTIKSAFEENKTEVKQNESSNNVDSDNGFNVILEQANMFENAKYDNTDVDKKEEQPFLDNFSFFDSVEDNINQNNDIILNSLSNNEDIKPSFNVKSELNKYIKQRKSFVDSVKDCDETYIPKVKDTTIISNEADFTVIEGVNEHANEVLTESAPLYTQEDIDKFFNNNFATKSENIFTSTLIENKENSNESRKDDAVFITESTDPESIPKVRKIEPAVFEHINKKTTTINYSQSDVAQLQKGKESESSIPTQKTTDEFYIPKIQEKQQEDSVYFYETDFTQIKSTYITKHGANLSNIQSPNMTLNKKANLVCNAITLLFVIVESLIIYFCFNKTNSFMYILVPILSSLPLILNLFYVSHKRFDTIKLYKFCQTISIIVTILLFAFNMLFGMTFSTIADFASTFILPSLAIITLPLSLLFKHIVYKL